jgi:hypothetical protein
LVLSSRYVAFLVGCSPDSFVLVCIELEGCHSPRSVSLTLLVTAGFLQLFTDIKPLSYLIEHPFFSVIAPVVYLILGPAWIRIKWGSFTSDIARKVNDWKLLHKDEKFDDEGRRNDRNGEVRPNNLHKAAAVYLSLKSIPLKVGDYKGLLFGWLFFWPVSLAWTVLNDPLRRIFNFIYDRCAVMLQEVSDKAFASKL